MRKGGLWAIIGALALAPSASALSTQHARHLMRGYERAGDAHHIRVDRCRRLNPTAVQCRVSDRITSDWTLDDAAIVMNTVSLDTVHGHHVSSVLVRFWN